MTRQMKHYNFPVRNTDGTFYEQVHPFDPSYFAVKVHPTGALLFTPHHSQLTLLQHIIIQSPFLKQPVYFLSDIPKYWIEDDGTMCLVERHLAQVAWSLSVLNLICIPQSTYALDQGGTMCLDKSHQWKSADTIAWLRTRGLHSVPNSIKAGAAAASIFANSRPSKSLSRKTSSWKTFRQLPIINVASKPLAVSFSIKSHGCA